MPNPEIAQMLTLSTVHVSKETADRLALCNIPAVYRKGEFGWFVYGGIAAELPADLRAVVDFAQLHGCEWIMLDRDADAIDELSIYDW
jgi:hypothetical protein